MLFDVALVSCDKYFVDAAICEFAAVGLSCCTDASDISEDTIVVFDSANASTPPKNGDKTVYIFDSESLPFAYNEHMVFVKPIVMSELVRTVLALKYEASLTLDRRSSVSIAVSDTFIVVQGKRIDLTKNEMLIFRELWNNKGEAVGKARLNEIICANTNGNMVTVYINRLREKLSSATEKKIISTVRDKGYVISGL